MDDRWDGVNPETLGLDLSAIANSESCEPSLPGSNHAPDDPALAQLLARTRSVAVVGLSPNPGRTSHGVAAWLQLNSHFELFWVNPLAADVEILGRPVYESLADLPIAPDMVDVFRRSEHVPQLVDQAIAAGAKSVWLQLGVVHEDAAIAAQTSGLDVVQNRCLKIEYMRLAKQIASARQG